LALGERRSQSAAEVMMLFGVDKSRIEVVSFGEEQPAEMGHGEEAWAKNRRVELRFN
jgi:peptidoglycan-associated lipoprotein